MSKTILNIIQAIGYSLILTMLVACSSLPWPIFPTKVNAKILASFEINPDAEGRPSPLVVRMYELKANNSFEQADFFKLYDEEAATLGGDLLTREEIEISPGEGREVEHKAHEDAHFFGVIAAFRNLQQSHWRAITPLKLNSKNNLIINIGKQTVTITQQ